MSSNTYFFLTLLAGIKNLMSWIRCCCAAVVISVNFNGGYPNVSAVNIVRNIRKKPFLHIMMKKKIYSSPTLHFPVTFTAVFFLNQPTFVV